MVVPPDSATRKARLRAALVAKRDQLDGGPADAASRAICAGLHGIDALDDVAAMAGYASIRNEADVSNYLMGRRRAGTQLYFPRVSGPTSLEFVAVDTLDTLSPGAFDVPEPSGPAAPLAGIDAFLVPGLAFDHRGRRLGFGRGFYDRALAEAINARAGAGSSAPLIVGVGYQWQLLEGDIPAESHDISMDIVATDDQIVHCLGR